MVTPVSFLEADVSNTEPSAEARALVSYIQLLSSRKASLESRKTDIYEVNSSLSLPLLFPLCRFA